MATRVSSSALVVIAVIVSVYALATASSVFAPVAFAFFGIALLWPVQKRLERLMPRGIALALSMIALVLVFLVFGYAMAWAFGRVGRWVILELPRFQALYDQAALWLDAKGIVIGGIWSDHFNARWLLGAIQILTSRANSTFSFWVVVFVYVILGLLEVRNFSQRAAALTNEDLRRVLLNGTIETAAKLRRYMIVRTQMSVLTGLLVGGVAWASGLNLAMEWGVIAFTLNYIPFIGPVVATAFPTAMALVHFDIWQSALLLFVTLNIVQSVVGSYVEPRVSGRALSISPPLVLFAVFFWSYLWGLLGAVIGVPITIALLTYCSQHPTSRWLSDLLSPPERVV